MKVLAIIAATLSYVYSQACTEPLEVQCADSIVASIQPCEEAAKEKGSDANADLECIKHAANVKIICWPCICKVANDNNVHINGCT